MRQTAAGSVFSLRDGQINAITPKKRISEEFMEYIGNKV
jgi:hypothetical protein